MSAQLDLFAPTYRDVEHLGCIERIPVPERAVGAPVGYDDRGQAIYRPLWADHEWFMTWVSFTDLERKRFRKSLRLTHLSLISWALPDHVSRATATSEQLTNWRDALATMRDLWSNT